MTKVYAVISNGEVNGELEGVFTDLEKARKKLRSMRRDWLNWAKGTSYDIEDDEPDHFLITCYDNDEQLECSVIETNLK